MVAIFEELGEGPARALLRVMDQAQQIGFLGPGPVEPHVRRALDLLRCLPVEAAQVLDLGSGGGLPGLPLALATGAETRWVLLDGSTTRASWLSGAVDELGLADRVRVVASRAEEAGRDPDLRALFQVVVSRSFGPPAVTAECASPFLSVGGMLIVAEPPGGSPTRWPTEGLALLGMQPGQTVTEPSSFQVIHQVEPCPERYPRRTGVPGKRPLF